jgi:PAT family beta-lactamase induction signal transducer AmpG
VELAHLTRPQKYLILTALYFAQGVPFGLFSQAVPVVLRQANTSLAVIGLSSLLAAPWGLKFLWAPWLDEAPPWGTRRKGWLIPIQIFAVLAMVGLALVDPWSQTGALMAVVLLVNFLNASQDVPTDGLAVDILSEQERGIGNGIQVGGYRLGMLMGGGAALLLIHTFGWTAGLLACAASLVVAMIPILLVRETSIVEDREASTASFHGLRRHFDVLWSFLKAPGIMRAVFVISVFKVGDALGGGMIRPMLVDRGFTMQDIGEIVGGVGFTASMVGTAIGAIVADRLPRRLALLVGVAFQTVGAGIYVLILTGATDRPMVAGVIATENLLGSIATVVLFTCMMDWARKEHSGSDYTLLASVVVLATGIGGLLSGVTAQQFGYAGHHAFAAAVTLVGGAFAVWAYRDVSSN